MHVVAARQARTRPTRGARRLLTGLLILLASARVLAELQADLLLSPPAWNPETARDALPPLDFAQQATLSPEIIAYFKRYGLHTPGQDHIFGTFQSGPFEVAAHFFVPEQARGTVLLLHGYLDHSGTHARYIKHLLEQGFAVASYDMPGHGLSSGPRADIGDFADYAIAFDHFLQRCRQHLPPPYHAIAHSTGAATVSSYLLTHPDDHLGQVVLVAPLVRSALWLVSTTTANLMDPFMNGVPRVFRKNSSDPAFLEFTRNDPLQPHRTTIDWVQAMVAWNKRVKNYPPSDKPVTIIQGDRDAVIDWDYNIAFLQMKFPRARVEMISGARHQLLGETPALRQQVVRIIDDTLATGATSP